MTQLTSIVEKRCRDAISGIRNATSIINAGGSTSTVIGNLTSAQAILDEVREDRLVPALKFLRAERIISRAMSVVGPYITHFTSAITSIPPIQGETVATNDYQGMINLVTSVNFTHRAIANGNWSNTATWSPAAVPPAGARVFISAARNVTYDVCAATSIKTIRVNGTLSVARTSKTKLVCDTIVIDHTGTLRIKPVSTVTCSIEFKGGPINTSSFDGRLMSRGLISHGTVDIRGAIKKPYCRIAGNPVSGVTKITLASAQPSWKSGDKIIITPVRHQGFKDSKSKAGPKVLYQITTIVNNVSITLDRATDRSFVLPTRAIRASAHWRERSAYVGNMTRNVVFRTAGTSVSIHRRGHFLAMHGDTTKVVGALFKHMGRTDKSVRAVDVDVSISTATSAKRNIKGRYSIHIHRAGLAGVAASITHNVVSGAPGWGIAHHDARANINDNIIYDFHGAAIMAEIGNEIGSWDRNLACRSFSSVNHITKDAEDVAAFDLGRNGDAFFFFSRGVSVFGNIASGLTGWGYQYFHRFPNKTDTEVSIQYHTKNEWEAMRYRPHSHPDRRQIVQFDMNEAFCCEGGFFVTKFNLPQNHALRTWLTNFLAFEVRIGMQPTYTSRYTIKECEVICTEVPATGRMGIRLELTADQVVASCRIRGFNDVAIRGDLWIHPKDMWVSTEPEFYTVGNIIISTVSSKWYGGNAAAYMHHLTQSQVSVNRPISLKFSTSCSTYNLTQASRAGSTSATIFTIQGSITDSLGTTKYPIGLKYDSTGQSMTNSGQGNFWRNVGRRGYWRNNGGKRYLVVREHYEDRLVKGKKIFRDILISAYDGFFVSTAFWWGSSGGFMPQYPPYRGSITSNIHGTCIVPAWTSTT